RVVLDDDHAAGPFGPAPRSADLALWTRSGGGGGIRTPGTLQSSGFQDRRLKPLGHSSTWRDASSFRFSSKSSACPAAGSGGSAPGGTATWRFPRDPPPGPEKRNTVARSASASGGGFR